jgi:protein-L-isoaspartate O-methyltransferase
MKFIAAGNQELNERVSLAPITDWEKLWAPYDLSTYQQVLQYIEPQDVVLEIGAGDLRLACRAAEIARKVIAIELQESLITGSRCPAPSNPKNLEVICADALTWPFPEGISKGILLMRHCSHFQEYAEKLKAAGAQGLVTNARWRMSVEYVDLHALRMDFDAFEMGWYSCWCGSTGFKAGPAERLVHPLEVEIHEVRNCSNCQI